VRAYDTVRYSHNAVKSFMVVLVERTTGVMVLVAIATVALLFEIKIIRISPDNGKVYQISPNQFERAYQEFSADKASDTYISLRLSAY